MQACRSKMHACKGHSHQQALLWSGGLLLLGLSLPLHVAPAWPVACHSLQARSRHHTGQHNGRTPKLARSLSEAVRRACYWGGVILEGAPEWPYPA